MLRAVLILLCCAVVFAQSAEPAKPKPAKKQACGSPEVNPDELWTPGAKVVGGKKAADRSWPWICALIQQKPGYYPYQFCGSTIIANQWIISAGHCVDSLSEEEIVRNVRVICGTNSLITGFMKADKLMFNISRVIKHDQYDVPEGSTNNDVTLIKLAKPLVYSKDIQPICLPTTTMEDKSKSANIDKDNGNNRKVGFVAGWGHLKEGQKNDLSQPGAPQVGAGTDNLQQVNINMYNATECKRKLRGYVYTDRMACGGFDKGGKDSCQGDSGGPLISKTTNGVWELIGVVSWGAGCARSDMPGIYANVHQFLSWITEKILAN